MLAIIGFWIAVADLFCWVVCFIWMHRISTRQNALLDELRQQGRRIEHVSNEEHRLVKDLHPVVGQMHHKIEMWSERSQNDQLERQEVNARSGQHCHLARANCIYA